MNQPLSNEIYVLSRANVQNIEDFQPAEKLLFGFSAVKLCRHKTRYVNIGQREIGSDIRGGKHQLQIDREVTQHGEIRHKTLQTPGLTRRKIVLEKKLLSYLQSSRCANGN